MIFGRPPFTNWLSDEEIAEICEVSMSTVYRWRSGRQDIPKTAKKLLDLYASGSVIPESWDGFRFDQDGVLWTSLDNHFQRHEIEQFQLYLSFWRTTSRANSELKEYIDYLERVTPKADVVPFDRSRCRKSLTEGMERNQLFNKPEEVN